MFFSCSKRRFGKYQVNTAPRETAIQTHEQPLSPRPVSFLDLPQEIILMVLLDVVEEEGEISWQERTRVQLICRALHDFVNLTPSFWSHLSVLEPRKLWQKQLEKSGQLELAVSCDCFPDQELHASFLETILPHAHRIYSLTCCVNYESSDEVAGLTTRAAPILRHLRLFYNETLSMRMDGIPFDDMLELETLELSGILIVREPMWWEGTVLRVVKLENVNWVYEIWMFLDFLEANDQLEKFHYSLNENVFSDDTLGPQTLPASYEIVLPNLTHLTLYSIPAFHLKTILEHVSFPPHSYINATVADSFPPNESLDFTVPVMNHLAALRLPSSLTLLFDKEESYIAAKEQRWNLSFYNEALGLEPREEAYRTLLQQIPPDIRTLISSVKVVDIEPDNAELLVQALSEDATSLTTFECPLDEAWLAALWMDGSRSRDGFRLPKVHFITFNVSRNTATVNIRTLRDFLQARSAAVQGGMPQLDTTVVVPMRYDEGEIKAALKDISLLNLGPRIDRVAMDEAEPDETLEEAEEDANSDDEESEQDIVSDGEENFGAEEIEGDGNMF